MRIFLKKSGIILASLLAFILFVGSLIKAFENNIAHITAERVSEEISAPIQVSSVNFNLLRSYPNSKIELNNVWLKDSLSTDTIAGIEHLYLSVNSHQAIKGTYLVNAIQLDGLSLNYIINRDSSSNIDFLMSQFMPTDTTTDVGDENNDSIPLKISLRQLLMKNILCSYFDSTSNIGAHILIPEISIEANVDGKNYSATSKGHITIKDIHYGDYNTNLIQSANLDYDLSYNDGNVQFNNILFDTDGMRFQLNGHATIGDTISLNTSIGESFIDIGKLIQYVPKAMLKELGLTDAKGIMHFSSKISGEYADSIMPEINANFKLENIAIATRDYPTITAFNLEGNASNGTLRNNSTTEIHITHCNLTTAQSGITAKANIKNLNEPSYNFQTQGHLDLEEIAHLLPANLVDYLKGKINWNISSYGTIPSKIDDTFTNQVLAQTAIELSTEGLSTKMDTTLCIEQLNTSMRYNKHHMVIDSLKVLIPDYDISIQDLNTDISFSGYSHDLSQFKLNIQHFNLKSDSTLISLDGEVKNLAAPQYDLEANADINLDRLKHLLPDSVINSLSGRIVARINSEATLNLDSLETQGMKIAFEQSSFNFKFKDINVQTPDSLYSINDLSLDMAMNNDTIDIDHFSGNYQGNTFNIFDTKIINAYKTALLNQKEELKVRTHLALGDINFSPFEPFMQIDSTAIADTSISTSINYTMDIKGNITMNSFYIKEYEVDTSITIRDLDIRDYSTKFRITDSTYIADSMIFSAFEGKINSSFRYDIKTNKEVVAMKSHIDGMDFKTLLKTMDNFGQEDLTDENISGQLTADIFGEAFIEGDSIPMDKLRARGDLTLENGGIYDFEPVEELSRFTGLKELDNIRFQTLNTQFFLFKGATYIPKTKIVSTALDANFYGMQSLKEDYEYHIEMFLSDVFTGKSENLIKRQKEAAKNDKKNVNRNGVEVRAQSIKGKTKYWLDTNKAQEYMKRKIRVQEMLLNVAFHPKRLHFNIEDTDDDNKK